VPANTDPVYTITSTYAPAQDPWEAAAAPELAADVASSIFFGALDALNPEASPVITALSALSRQGIGEIFRPVSPALTITQLVDPSHPGYWAPDGDHDPAASYFRDPAGRTTDFSGRTYSSQANADRGYEALPASDGPTYFSPPGHP
jgi:hypothetical protein